MGQALKSICVNLSTTKGQSVYRRKERKSKTTVSLRYYCACDRRITKLQIKISTVTSATRLTGFVCFCVVAAAAVVVVVVYMERKETTS